MAGRVQGMGGKRGCGGKRAAGRNPWGGDALSLDRASVHILDVMLT